MTEQNLLGSIFATQYEYHYDYELNDAINPNASKTQEATRTKSHLTLSAMLSLHIHFFCYL